MSTVLLTDFDGVIAPFGAVRPSHPRTLVRPGGYLDSAFVTNGLPELLWNLHAAGRFHWELLSSWGEETGRYLEPFGVHGLHAHAPGVLRDPLSLRHYKAGVVAHALAAGERVVWAEDLEVGGLRAEYPDDAAALLDHERLLVIEPRSDVGLTLADVRRIIRFASR